jgi:hypothetical protein
MPIFVFKIAVAICVVYALTVALGYFAQRKLMYFPIPERVAPSEVGLSGVEERIIQTPDGERVVAWYGRAQPGQARNRSAALRFRPKSSYGLNRGTSV